MVIFCVCILHTKIKRYENLKGQEVCVNLDLATRNEDRIRGTSVLLNL